MTNFSTIDRPDIKEAIEADISAKNKQKLYKDDKSYVKHHEIGVGDTVLLKQKPQKHVTPYDPEPYTVSEVHGHQVTALRDSQKKTRDAQKWKKVNIRAPVDFQQARHREIEQQLQKHYDDDTIDIGTNATSRNTTRCQTTPHHPPQQHTNEGSNHTARGSTPSEPPSNGVPISPPTRSVGNRRTTRRRKPPPHLEDYQR